MGKGLGISAFVLLLISYPIPFLGNYLAILALLIAAAAAFAGEKTWAIVVSIVGGIMLFFLSPTWMVLMYSHRALEGTGALGYAMAANQRASNTSYWYFTLFVVLLPIAIMVWRSFTTPQPATETLEPGKSE